MAKNDADEKDKAEDILDKMRVLTMALWGNEAEDPNREFKTALSSFAADIVGDMEDLFVSSK